MWVSREFLKTLRHEKNVNILEVRLLYYYHCLSVNLMPLSVKVCVYKNNKWLKKLEIYDNILLSIQETIMFIFMVYNPLVYIYSGTVLLAI